MNAPTKAAATSGAEAVLPAALAPRAEGPRIYNLFPLLVGRVSDWTAELPRIACPALVAVGRHDWICPVDQAEEIHRLVPHSTLVVFETSGHSPHVEERPAFVRALGATFRSSAPP